MIEVLGQVIRADAGDVAIGEVCRLERRGREPLEAEVIGFEGDQAILVPYGDVTGLRASAEVQPTGRGLTIRCGKDLRGVALDGLGRPYPKLGAQGTQGFDEELSVETLPVTPGSEVSVRTPLSTGIRAIDGCMTLGEGQRIGLYAGQGVGKATLMGRIACFSSADVVVLYCGAVRRRELVDFFESELGPEGQARSVVVATENTDAPLARVRGAFVAQRVAEYFRDQGLRVLLLVDDLRAVADAQNEIARLLGEPESKGGFAPSVYFTLSQLIGRAFNSQAGSITGIYNVSMRSGAMDDPLADFTRTLLDGHIILNRQLGARNHWPAIDVPVSLSRVMNSIVGKRHKELALKVRSLFDLHEKNRDALGTSSYMRGKDGALDEAVDRIDRINGFLRQGLHEKSTLEETVAAMERIFA